MVKKILFLPLLQLSSGHHQVADTLAEYALRHDPSRVCQKVDLLHYGFGGLETWISRFYLHWIRLSPGTYHWLYRRSVESAGSKSFPLYDYVFRPVFARLIERERPDLIICTHALPSYIAHRMKIEQKLDVPVVNVYTDFFINALWGTDGIDFHLVPDAKTGQVLLQRGVPENRIFVTGIPVHPAITPPIRRVTPCLRRPVVLITGGHLGVGGLHRLIQKLPQSGQIHYMVLCGKNKGLYERLMKERHPHLTPVPYISCRKQMNAFYEQADAVLTKPGGVTISECLRKRRPVFIYGALPGQEAYNLRHLKESGLVFDLNETSFMSRKSWEDIMMEVLRSESQLTAWNKKLDLYMGGIREQQVEALFAHIFQ